jgi:cobalt-zinc-cadmium efflux system outer membrane protein
MFRTISAIGAGWLLLVAPAFAQTVLTLEATIARARDQAGPVVVSRARIAESEAALVEVTPRFRDNPLIGGVAGPRFSSEGPSTELDFGLSQQFETGGQRQARITAARAGIERQQAETLQLARTVVFEAASAFLAGIAATERLRVAEEADTVARELLRATERRYVLGDIAAIDVNMARLDAARSAATLVAARADLTAAAGALRALLRIPVSEPLELRGSLELPAPPPVEVLEANVVQRPEFAALSAEVREAEAQVQLGRALRRPDLGFNVGYERDVGDSIVLGGLVVTLPAFQRGQGTLALGTARANRARVEADIARETAIAELRAAHSEYEQRAGLAAALQRDTALSLDDNEGLATRSYEAGEMNLMDLLQIRRDALGTRLTIIDRHLDAARARLSVDFAAGVLQ